MSVRFIALALILALMAPATAETPEILEQNTLIIDGDQEAMQLWEEWSNYKNSNGNIVHSAKPEYYFGKRILLFNTFMYRKYNGGWEHLSEENVQIVVQNVYQYVLAFTGFEDSTITVKDCKDVVFGPKFVNPENTAQSIGWLYNTQINVQGFDNVTFFNYDWSQSQGTPVEIAGGRNSTLELLGSAFTIESETLSKEPGMIVKNVKSVTLSSNYMFIGGYTPALTLENIADLFINRVLTINNEYYSYSDSAWSHGGTGILADNVQYFERGNNSDVIKIENCHVGVAFEDHGKDALNNSPYLEFYNCDQDYMYGYTPSSHTSNYPALIQGVQALSSIFVAVAWIRVGVLYFSDDELKKKLAKELFLKVSIGTLMVSMLVFGYTAAMNVVTWVFGK